MDRRIYLLPLLLIGLVLATSCKDTQEVGKFDNWKARNEAYMDSLQNVYDTKPNHGGLGSIVPMSNKNLRIYYKKIIEKDTTFARPLFTDTAVVYYRGSYIFGEVFDQNFKGADPNPDFDVTSSFSIQNFYSLSGGGVSGWADILQMMRVGERWTTYIPWQMAYGSGGNNAIPGYSTLIFDIQLTSIKKQIPKLN